MAFPIRDVYFHWHDYFRNFNYSVGKFYTLVENNIKERKIPNSVLSRVWFFQNQFFWKKREYLRVKSEGYIFDICAAPYGNDFFVSWRVGQSSSWLYRVCIKTPFIGPIIEAAFEKRTYYQLDRATMFQECIKLCVKEAIESISNESGTRLTSLGNTVIQTLPYSGRR